MSQHLFLALNAVPALRPAAATMIGQDFVTHAAIVALGLGAVVVLGALLAGWAARMRRN